MRYPPRRAERTTRSPIGLGASQSLSIIAKIRSPRRRGVPRSAALGSATRESRESEGESRHDARPRPRRGQAARAAALAGVTLAMALQRRATSAFSSLFLFLALPPPRPAADSPPARALRRSAANPHEDACGAPSPRLPHGAARHRDAPRRPSGRLAAAIGAPVRASAKDRVERRMNGERDCRSSPGRNITGAARSSHRVRRVVKRHPRARDHFLPPGRIR